MRLFYLTLICASCAAAASPEISGCAVFSANNIWNTAVDKLPVASTSGAYVATIGAKVPLHPDFSSNPIYGIPFNVIPNEKKTKNVPVKFLFSDESDRVVYPIPQGAVVESGSDGHLLILDKQKCILYELFAYAPPTAPGQPYTAAAGAVWDLHWDNLRPVDWTSSDAAGLPILPGLIRYDEIAAGEINHAIRFTAPQTQEDYVWPARHYASHLTGAQFPPMGTRFRLKASVNISKFSKTNQIILTALKKYGLMLADNGVSWYITGAPDPRWQDSDLALLSGITGSDFEEVDATVLNADRDTGEISPTAPAH